MLRLTSHSPRPSVTLRLERSPACSLYDSIKQLVFRLLQVERTPPKQFWETSSVPLVDTFASVTTFTDKFTLPPAQLEGSIGVRRCANSEYFLCNQLCTPTPDQDLICRPLSVTQLLTHASIDFAAFDTASAHRAAMNARAKAAHALPYTPGKP